MAAPPGGSARLDRKAGPTKRCLCALPACFRVPRRWADWCSPCCAPGTGPWPQPHPPRLSFLRPPLPPVWAACRPICRACCGQSGRHPWRMPGSAVDALPAVLIRMLACASGAGLCVGAAPCCAFLALMAEGILCFLRRYITAPLRLLRPGPLSAKPRRAFARRGNFVERDSLQPHAPRHVGQGLPAGSALRRIRSSYASSTAGKFLASCPAGEYVSPVGQADRKCAKSRP